MSEFGIDELIAKVQRYKELPSPDQRKAIRLRAGVSLRDAAAAIGATQPTISAYERGSTPRLAFLDSYVELLRRLEEVMAE